MVKVDKKVRIAVPKTGNFLLEFLYDSINNYFFSFISVHLWYTHYADSFDMLQAMFQNFFFFATSALDFIALNVSTSVAGVTFWEEQLLVTVVFLSDNHTSSE